MKIALLTLGCKVNYYESEKILKGFAQRGCAIVDFTEKADVYIINTCTVTNIADRKSRQMIHRARKMSEHALVVAVGCYVESAGPDMEKDPSVDLALTNRDKEELAERVLRFWEERNKSRTGRTPEDDRPGQSVTDTHKKRTRAFIKVQDGCNQFCSYCLIPFVRGGGKLSSTPPEEVAEEITGYVESGCPEVVINGIHLSSYGVTSTRSDGFVQEGGVRLMELIRRVQEIPGLKRIRLGSLEPRIITKNWLDGLKDCDKLCPHFHLSLQSGCDATLARMNRHYTTEDYRRTVALLREMYDAPAITTDVIVGFPGETEEEFLQTVAFLDEIGFADLHIFQYSLRDGTRAAGMDGQVAPAEKKRRSEELLGRLDGWRERYRAQAEPFAGEVLFEEIVTENGVRFLAGYNERYLRFGVKCEEAEARGWEPGRIESVDRELFLNL